MTKENKKISRLAKAMLETAKDMRHAGLLDEAAYGKITLRHTGMKEKVVVESLTGEDIHAIREQSHESGDVCPLSELNVRLRVATGTRRKASCRSRSRAVKPNLEAANEKDKVFG